MKKIYLEPEVEIINAELEGFLCGSTGTDGGDSDGGTDISEEDPSDPNWGIDF